MYSLLLLSLVIIRAGKALFDKSTWNSTQLLRALAMDSSLAYITCARIGPKNPRASSPSGFADLDTYNELNITASSRTSLAQAAGFST